MTSTSNENDEVLVLCQSDSKGPVLTMMGAKRCPAGRLGTT